MGLFGHNGWFSRTGKWLQRDVFSSGASGGGEQVIYFGTSANIDEKQINDYETTMDFAENTQGGGHMASNYATTSYDDQENQDWYDRNKDWIVPAATTATQIGYNIYANNQQQKFAAEEAEKNRIWEKNMSDTEIQRRMADARAAGLNPNLAIGQGSGASTPGGGQGTSAGMHPMDISGTMANTANALKTALESKWVSPEKKSQIANTAANTVLAQEQTKETTANKAKIEQETVNLQEMKKQIAEQVRHDKMNNDYNDFLGLPDNSPQALRYVAAISGAATGEVSKKGAVDDIKAFKEWCKKNGIDVLPMNMVKAAWTQWKNMR